MKWQLTLLSGVVLISACAARSSQQGAAASSQEAAVSSQAAAPAPSPTAAGVVRSRPLGQLLGALHGVKAVDTGRCEELAEGFVDALGADITNSDVQAWAFTDRIVTALANMNRAAKAHGIEDFDGWSGELELASEVESSQDYSLLDMTYNGAVTLTNQVSHAESVTDVWVLMQAEAPHKVMCAWERTVPPAIEPSTLDDPWDS